MEPAQASVKTNYVIESYAIKVEERFFKHYITGVGPDAIFTDQSLGWFVYIHGSHEAIHLGAEQPAIAKGDRIKITIERIG